MPTYRKGKDQITLTDDGRVCVKASPEKCGPQKYTPEQLATLQGLLEHGGWAKDGDRKRGSRR